MLPCLRYAVYSIDVLIRLEHGVPRKLKSQSIQPFRLQVSAILRVYLPTVFCERRQLRLMASTTKLSRTEQTRPDPGMDVCRGDIESQEMALQRHDMTRTCH